MGKCNSKEAQTLLDDEWIENCDQTTMGRRRIAEIFGNVRRLLNVLANEKK